MTHFGYQASHEQFTPSELLRWSVMAEAAGFQFINSSDHFNPWSERQGQSGYSFAWLGAAMSATRVPFGIVCCPCYRYHPAIVAQAAATLAEMFPDRFFMSLGSGEALNEKIIGIEWPKKDLRNAKLRQAYQIIKRLLNGESVTEEGHVSIRNARLWTRPKEGSGVPLIGAAVTKETAKWMGSWADGLITVSQPHEQLKEVVGAFRENGGNGKPVYLKVQLSYSSTLESAEQGAYDQWRNNIFSGSLLEGLETVEQFDKLGQDVDRKDLHEMIRISPDPERHIKWLREDMDLGFERIVLHNVNRDQDLFISDFGKKVLPFLR